MFDPVTFIKEFSEKALAQDFKKIEYGEIDDLPLVAFEKPSRVPLAPRVYLSAGVHGDEPAAPFALLESLRRQNFDPAKSWTICPMINPVGLRASIRENGKGIDLNRDFRNPTQPETRQLVAYLDSKAPYELSICLHEDWETNGFYLYSLGEKTETNARAILSQVAKVGPIETRDEIDGHPSLDGLIARPEVVDPFVREDWPEAFYLCSRKVHPHYTMESPSSLPLENRIQMHLAAMHAAVAISFTRIEK